MLGDVEVDKVIKYIFRCDIIFLVGGGGDIRRARGRYLA